MSREEAAHGLIGVSAALQSLRQEIRLLSGSAIPVLISGEVGTGKRLVASLLHQGSDRGGALLTIECGSVSNAALQETFSKAAIRASSAEVRNAGTVVLQDVDRLSRESQELVFRHLESGLGRIDGTRGTPLGRGFRLIATTACDLCEKAETGQFRDDLYYRLNAAHLVTPPLRERREDIPILGQTWLRASAERRQLAPPQLPTDALKVLLAYDWPGNVTELKDVMDRLGARFAGGVVSSSYLVLLLEDAPAD